ncbi:retrovirus-related pol polyprotein from transposon TNT 1-94 [Tanacetum coccineum]
MTMPRMQLNSKFVNNMLPEWSRFITEVKLNRGLKESNFDQLYAYLKQHEVHANENRIMMERFIQPNNDPLALVSDASVQQYPTQSSKSPQSSKEPSPADHFQLDSGSPSTENLIESLSNTLALLTQSYKSHLPQTNNQLRASSNARNKAMRNNARGNGVAGNVGAQNRGGMINPGQVKPIKCYNCNGLGHIARECPRPKRLQDSDYFKDKMLLMQAQENGAVLDEEQSLFLAGEQVTNVDDDVDDSPENDLALNVDHVFEADECDAFDSDVDEGPTSQTMFMANLTSEDPIYDEAGPSYDSNNPFEVQDHDTFVDHMDEYHEVHEMQNDVQHNYVGVQSRLANKPDMVVNDSVTSELARYKELVGEYEKRAKFELTDRERKIDEQMRIIISDRNRKETSLKSELHSAQILLSSTVDHYKSKTKEVTLLKKDFKQKEDKFLEEFLDIKKLKDKIEDRLYKQDQSVQTVHMLCKPKSFYDEKHKVAIGYKNPLCLARAKQAQSVLYSGHALVTTNHAPTLIHDSEDTRLAPSIYSKETFLPTLTPQRNLTPEQIFWSIDNNNRKKAETSVPKPISALTVYPPNTPVKLVPRILPTKSQVKINLYVLTQLFTEFEFDKTCKTRITPSGLTEGERGFEQTKRCYLTEVIPFFKTLKEHFVGVQTALFKEVKEMEEIFDQMNNEVDKNTVDKQCAEIEKKNLLIENENLIVNCLSTQLLYDVEKSRCLDLEADMSKVHDESKLISKLEREYLNLQLKYQHLQESFDNKNSQASQEAPDFNSFFKIKNLEHQIQEKDNVIRHLKDRVANVNDRSRVPYNAIDVTALIEQNDCDRVELEKVKQHYKELYDSIKITRAHTSEKTSTMLNEIESLKAQLRSKESCFTSEYVKPKVLAPGMYAIDVKPIPHPLKNNRSAHLNYISHLKESVETVREIVEEARVVKPLDNSLNYACQYTKLSQEFDKPGTSSSNTQKHKVHQRVQQTNNPVIPSTRVNDSTEASGSKPRSNTKKNRILPAKKENKKEVEVRLRTNKSVWTKVNRVDSSISSKRVVINSNSESVCKTCNKCVNSASHGMCVVNILNSVNATPTVRIVLNKEKQIWKPKGKLSDNSLNKTKQIWKPKGKLSDNSLYKTKRVWKATGKLFADIGYQWRPTGKKLTLGKLDCGSQWRPTGKKFALGEMCHLTKLSVKCRTGHALVSGLRLFKTYDGESFKAHEFCGKVHRVLHISSKSVRELPQQIGVVERRNRFTGGKQASTLRIFSKAPIDETSYILLIDGNAQVVPYQVTSLSTNNCSKMHRQPVPHSSTSIVILPVQHQEIQKTHQSFRLLFPILNCPKSNPRIQNGVIEDCGYKAMQDVIHWNLIDLKFGNEYSAPIYVLLSLSVRSTKLKLDGKMVDVLKNNARLVAKGLSSRRKKFGMDLSEPVEPANGGSIETASRPNLVFAVCMCARYQAKPTKKHFEAIKRVFRYLKGTIHMGSLVSERNAMSLKGLCYDAVMRDVKIQERSTSGSAQFLGDRCSKTTDLISNNNSSVLGITKCAIGLLCNNVQHSRSKTQRDIHRHHFIREQGGNEWMKSTSGNEYQLCRFLTKISKRTVSNFFFPLGMKSLTPETLKRLQEGKDE